MRKVYFIRLLPVLFHLFICIVGDITALVTNADAGGLGSGTYDSVDLYNNPLSAQAIDVDIPYLQGEGVEVVY